MDSYPETKKGVIYRSNEIRGSEEVHGIVPLVSSDVTAKKEKTGQILFTGLDQTYFDLLSIFLQGDSSRKLYYKLHFKGSSRPI